MREKKTIPWTITPTNVGRPSSAKWMEGPMDSIPGDARRCVTERSDEAYKDRYAEVDVRFGMFVTQPRPHFETDIGKRAMDKIGRFVGFS